MVSLVSFTIAYTVGLTAYGAAIGSPLTFLYAGINTGLFILFVLLHRMMRWSLPALWAASLVGLGNMLGGVLLVDGQTLYLTNVIGPIGYDKLFHFAAAAGMSAVALEAVRRSLGRPSGTFGVILITWLVVNGGGAVVEIGEFIGASIGDVNVGDYANNALDLVANASGAALGVGLLVIAERRRNTGVG
jgi:hypothetical protein